MNILEVRKEFRKIVTTSLWADEVEEILPEFTRSINELDLNNFREMSSVAYEKAGAKNAINLMKAVSLAVGECLGKELKNAKHRLSRAEEQIVRNYCNQSYTDVNEMLLGYGERDPKTFQFISDLDYILDVHSQEFTGTLFRSMQLTRDQLENLNGEFEFKNYVSTSVTPAIIYGNWLGNAAYEFIPQKEIDEVFETNTFELDTVETLFIIECNDVPVMNTAPFSFNPMECEYLLSRGTTVKINSVKEINGKRRKQIIVKCEVML